MMPAWCNPVEHAMVLIDACGSLDAAQNMAAADNFRFSGTEKDAQYWFSVADALVPQSEAQA